MPPTKKGGDVSPQPAAPPSKQGGNFSARTETAVTSGTDAREGLKASLTRAWKKGSLALGLLLFLVWGFFYIPGYWRSGVAQGASVFSSSDDTEVVIGRAWSPVIQFQLGQQVLWDRRENADYEVRIPVGDTWKTYQFPRDPEGDPRTPCERQVWIREHFTRFQMRVTDKEKEAATFDFVFSPYTPDGPCGPKVVPVTVVEEVRTVKAEEVPAKATPPAVEEKGWVPPLKETLSPEELEAKPLVKALPLPFKELVPPAPKDLMK